METKDQEYTNPFEEVHRKAKAFKDHVRESSKNDAERRERLAEKDKEILDEKHF